MSPMYGVHGAMAEWLASRDDANMASESSYAASQYATATNTTPAAISTTTDAMIIDQLRFDAARSIRTSTIILASFNTLAAFATAVGILLDGYIRERKNRPWPKFKRRGNNLFGFVPPYDIFPLVLSCGITAQGITFAVAQSKGLDALLGLGCTAVSHAVFPALFVVPYIQLVFGVEMLIRALRKTPFRPRGKYDVAVCVALVVVFTLATLLVAIFDPASDFCFTDLFWFVAHWSEGIFALLTAIASILLLAAVAIFVRLHRYGTKAGETERIAASRMVYHLALAVISNAFMIPFFFTITFGDMDTGDDENLSMVAAVVANLSGLMTGCLYLFLKSNMSWNIGSKGKVAGGCSTQRKQPDKRCSGASDPDFLGYMMQPVTGPDDARRVQDEAKLLADDDDNGKEDKIWTDVRAVPTRNVPPLHLDTMVSTPTAMRPPPVPARGMPPSPERQKAQQQSRTSYSLFPQRSDIGSTMTETSAKASAAPLLPATTYSPTTDLEEDEPLKPPPPIAAPSGFRRHRRDSSMISSATVQIGLRLSSMDDMMVPLDKDALAGNGSVYDLVSPRESRMPAFAPTMVTGECPKRPSPLRTMDLPPSRTPSRGSEEVEIAIQGKGKEKEVVEEIILDESPVRDARMKTLPPIPRPGTAVQQSPPVVTLSPTVYKPESRTPSRTPSRKSSTTSRPQGTTRSASNRSVSSTARPPPPPRRKTGDAPAPVAGTANWI